MNKTETVLFCRYVKAMCPAQVLDEYTPDAWSEVLDEISLEDAKDAVRAGIRAGWRFVDVGEVLQYAEATRAMRLVEYRRKHGALIPPRGFDGTIEEEHSWLAAAQDRILNGEVTEPEELGTEALAPPIPIASRPNYHMVEPQRVTPEFFDEMRRVVAEARAETKVVDGTTHPAVSSVPG